MKGFSHCAIKYFQSIATSFYSDPSVEKWWRSGSLYVGLSTSVCSSDGSGWSEPWGKSRYERAWVGGDLFSFYVI